MLSLDAVMLAMNLLICARVDQGDGFRNIVLSDAETVDADQVLSRALEETDAETVLTKSAVRFVVSIA